MANEYTIVYRAKLKVTADTEQEAIYEANLAGISDKDIIMIQVLPRG